MNNYIFNIFFNLSSNPFLGSLAISFSYLLTYLFICIVFVGSIFSKKRKMYNFSLLFLSGFFSWIIARIIKFIFQIQRPFIQKGLTPLYFESGYSFPSEHASVLFGLSFVVFSLNKRFGIVSFIFAFFVSISRIVIGVHDIIDIIGGAFVGVLIAYFFVRIFRKI